MTPAACCSFLKPQLMLKTNKRASYDFSGMCVPVWAGHVSTHVPLLSLISCSVCSPCSTALPLPPFLFSSHLAAGQIRFCLLRGQTLHSSPCFSGRGRYKQSSLEIPHPTHHPNYLEMMTNGRGVNEVAGCLHLFLDITGTEMC